MLSLVLNFVLYVLQVPTLKVQNLENALYALQEPFHCKDDAAATPGVAFVL